MTRRQRLTTILSLGLPIIGGMFSQSLLNLVDAAMVGALGETSLAGVGIGSYISFIAVSLLLGLSSGVQTLCARLRGEERTTELAQPLYWGLLVAAAAAIPLTILFIATSGTLAGLFSEDIATTTIAEQYFDYRAAGLLAVGLSLCLRGYWNGTNRPMIYLRVLIMVHILNVLLSLALIYGYLGLPAMGAPGAGLGTTLSLITGVCIIGALTLRDIRWNRQQLNLADTRILRSLLRLSIPHSLQQFFFAAATAALFWIIGLLGTEQLAIAHILVNLSLLLILPAVGLGIASTSLVSHAIGQKNPDLASRWGWDVIKTATFFVALLSIPMWLIPEQILSLFLTTDQAITEATLPLMITGLAICVDAAAIVLSQALLGTGASRMVMMVTTAGQWGIYLPLAFLFGPWLGFGLTGIWTVQLLFRALSSMLFIYIWYRRDWVHIRI